MPNILPYGCYSGYYLKDLWVDSPLDCIKLTEPQKTIIKFLQSNKFDLLRVSAPSWTTGRKVNHHANTNSIDFTADAQSISELFRAWEFMRRNWPGTVLLGIYDPPTYTAQLHLHVSGTLDQKVYIHGFETKAGGKEIITSNDSRFQTALNTAKRIYNWRGEYIPPPTPAINKTGLPLALIGALVGGAIAYKKEHGKLDTIKLSLYIAAGTAIGAVLKSITKQMPSFGNKP